MQPMRNDFEEHMVPRARRHETLDALYAELHRMGPSLRNGFTSHMPMVVEALFGFGAVEAACRAVRDHAAFGTPRPAHVAPIDPADFRAAFGDALRFSDWSVFFRNELETHGVARALDLWCARLASGFVASATHGVLRTAHAARAYAASPSAVRRIEIAEGLALWASEHQTLPGGAMSPFEGTTPTMSEVRTRLARVPRVPRHARRPEGSLVAALAAIDDVAEAFATSATLRVVGDVTDAVLVVAEVFAETFLAEARDGLTGLVFTHAITSTEAVVELARWVSDATGRRLVAEAFRSGAALLAVYASETPNDVMPAPEPMAKAIASAITSGDDHVIKLTAACARLHAASRRPIFALVPARAHALVGRGYHD